MNGFFLSKTGKYKRKLKNRQIETFEGNNEQTKQTYNNNNMKTGEKKLKKIIN